MNRRLVIVGAAGFAAAAYLLAEWWGAHPHLVPPMGGIWLIEPASAADRAIQVEFPSTAPEARGISDWVEAHQTHWSFTKEVFKPQTTQLVSDMYSIELVDGSILIRYVKEKWDEPGSFTTVKRPLSAEEQAYWTTLIGQIKKETPSPASPSGT
jgi:hypothetical protein